MFRWLRIGDRRGNVAVIAALCAPIMMLMVGAAIDYGYALNINQRLNGAADTAVLSAISPSIAQGAGSYAKAYNGGYGAMHNVGVNTFAINTSTLPITVSPSVNITTSTNNGVTSYTATLTYSTSVPTFFAGIVGMPSIPISGHAQATTTPLTYIRYYVLVDISQSMGVGSTPADMQNLYIRIANNGQGTDGDVGCVFGCHVADPGQANSNENYAHNTGGVSYNKSGSYGADSGGYINLRIDSAKTAINSIIQTAISDENPTTPNISIGVYTMTAFTSPMITPIFPTGQTTPTSTNGATWQATTNLSSVSTSAIDLGANNTNGLGDSDLQTELTQFASYLPAQGTGASASSPINYVFLITDGVVDYYGSSCTSTHCTSALQPSYCSGLQQKANVGVIYTTYNPIYANPLSTTNSPTNGPWETHYQQLVLPFVNQLQSNLSACASSSSLFFPASSGPQIVSAMQSLFSNSLQNARLTQ